MTPPSPSPNVPPRTQTGATALRAAVAPPPRPLVIVTGASSNHHRCLKHLLLSLATMEPGVRVIIYDLGLTPAERGDLGPAQNEVRGFPFASYPPHVDLARNRGNYAWKPLIVAEVMGEAAGDVLWLDAGNLVLRPLTKLRANLAAHGVYSPLSAGTIAEWTHPGTLARMNVPASLHARRNRNAAIVGLSTAPQSPGPLIAQRWRDLALDVDCIAPRAATLSNHRYDQAILSILLATYQPEFGYQLPSYSDEVTTHHDSRSEAEVRRLLGLPLTAKPRVGANGTGQPRGLPSTR